MLTEVDRFLAAQPGGIEERAAEQLRTAPAEIQRLVLRRGGLAGTRDSTAVLISRIRNAQEGLKPVNDSDKKSEVVERFLSIECVEPHAAARLRKASKYAQDSVISRGSLSGTRDPTAVLMSRIRDAEKDAPAEERAATPEATDAESSLDWYTQVVQQWGEEYAVAYLAQIQQYQLMAAYALPQADGTQASGMPVVDGSQAILDSSQAAPIAMPMMPQDGMLIAAMQPGLFSCQDSFAGMLPAGYAAIPGMQPMAMPGMQPMAMPGMQSMAMPGMQPMAMPGMQTMAMPGMQAMAMPGMPATAMPQMQPMAMPGMQTGMVGPDGFQVAAAPGVGQPCGFFQAGATPAMGGTMCGFPTVGEGAPAINGIGQAFDLFAAGLAGMQGGSFGSMGSMGMGAAMGACMTGGMMPGGALGFAPAFMPGMTPGLATTMPGAAPAMAFGAVAPMAIMPPVAAA